MTRMHRVNQIDTPRGKLGVLLPGLRTVLMSGYSAGGPQQLALDANVAFIQKPFTRAALAAKLREVLQGSEAPEAG